MLSFLWNIIPVPLGIATIIYGLTSTGTHAQDNDTEDISYLPETERAEAQQIQKENALYFKLIFIGLGLGSILFGLKTVLPDLELYAKIVFLLTFASTFGLKVFFKFKPKQPPTDNV